MSASNIVFMVFSGIALVLSIIPLWWHLPSWNVGTCMYMIWTALACLVYFVNSVVWNGNVINWAPVWCDIAIRIQVGATVAWPACILCIIRSLYHATVATIRSEIRREVIINLFITVGIPVLVMGLEYIAAGHRFDIFEDYGCTPAIYNTSVALVLLNSWPLAIGLLSASYGVLTVRAFMKRRKQLRDLIASNADWTYSRYWRLTAVACVDLFFTIPLATWGIVGNLIHHELHPWISWDNTHFDYSRVDQIPRVLLDQSPLAVDVLEINRWGAVLCSFVFFTFFGVADEARKNYRFLASAIAKRLGWTLFVESTATSETHVRSSLHFASGNPSAQSATRQTAFSGTSSVVTSVEGVLAIPEAVHDPSSARSPSVPSTPEAIPLGDAADRV